MKTAAKFAAGANFTLGRKMSGDFVIALLSRHAQHADDLASSA
jgi:hypothetical protein